MTGKSYLRVRRRQLDLRQADLAKVVGCSPALVSEIEAGKFPASKFRPRIEQALMRLERQQDAVEAS
jgi:predicted transcriptional regulator